MAPLTRTLKLTLEYDGTGYEGWQIQPQGETLQGVIEASLLRILGSPHRLHGAGRTDAGVHARGQVAHFVTVHPMPAATLQKALNATLPKDLAVSQLEEVPSTFHSRYSAHSKQYAYQIWLRPERSPFLERFAWHIRKGLNVERMSEAAQHLVGTHDFSAFRAADCTARHAVRTLTALRLVQPQPGLLRVELEGPGFLKHMVRNIVGTLVDVGQGRQSVAGFVAVLEGKDRRRAGKTAPAKGLSLEWVRYTAEV